MGCWLADYLYYRPYYCAVYQLTLPAYLPLITQLASLSFKMKIEKKSRHLEMIKSDADVENCDDE